MTSTLAPAAAAARRAVDRAGLVAAGVLAALLCGLGWLRHVRGWSGLDLAILDQGVWLLSKGRAPETSLIGANLFADHVSPALVLFAPLYRLAATPFWLVLAQSVAVGLTVLPLRALARHEGAPPWAATVAVAGSAPLLSAAFFEVHVLVLAVPALAWLLLAARRGDVAPATVAAALVLLCRTELAWGFVGIAVVALPPVRRRLLLLVPPALAVAWVVPALLGTRQTWERHYGGLGDGPLDAVLSLRIVGHTLSSHTLEVLLLVLLPVGFLALARPRWAAALGLALLPVLASTTDATAFPWFHHAAATVPLAIGGALAAIARLHHRTRTLAVGAAGIAISLLVASPLAPGAPRSVSYGAVTSGRQAGLRALAGDVRPGESVAASALALPHVAHRAQVFLFPCPWDRGDGYVCDGDPDAQVDVLLLARDDWSRAEALGYEPVRTEADWALFRS